MRMAIGFGRVTFGPVPFRDGAAWSVGSVGRNCGLIRAFVAASNPDVSLISFGSLKAVPTKLMPTGSPKMFPFLDKSKCCCAPRGHRGPKLRDGRFLEVRRGAGSPRGAGTRERGTRPVESCFCSLSPRRHVPMRCSMQRHHAPPIASLARIVVVLVVALAVTTSCGDEPAQPRGGRFLVYSRHLNSKRQAVWIARIDGTQPRLLVRQGIFGALSPDGRWVAYNMCLASQDRCQTGNAPDALFLIASSGGKSRLLARSTSYPSWSPRSDRIVALRKNALVTVDLDGNLRVLEPNPATAGWSFSPDGDWVVYAKARQHTKCASDLFVVRATGGGVRRLTHGRDMFPVWGRHWIAFSRYPKTCAYARRIWRVRADGTDTQAVTGAPPPGYAQGGYYGFDPLEWTPDERELLAGLASEWGAEAIRVDIATGAFRKLSGYALDLSRDGRVALVDSGGSEGPQTIAAVALADGSRHVLAHGDVAFPSWNR